MKIGHFEITKKGWKYKGLDLKKPWMILWSLIILPLYFFFLFGFALMVLLITFDREIAVEIIDENWPW